jgi:NTP pyrophosphatase (non-canonical NTP hydrolase)
MNNSDSLKDLLEHAVALSRERDWAQFHAPKNLAINLSLEANELLEHFVWHSDAASYDRARERQEVVGHEMADVLFTLLLLSERTGIDLVQAFREKLAIIKKKYPVEKSRGNAKKYTEL